MAEPREQKTHEDLEATQEKHRETRDADESAEREDLNQGMDTGTHESTRFGVNWGNAYQQRPNEDPKKKKPDTDTSDKKNKPQNETEE